MNALAIIQKKIQKARAISDSQIHITKYRGVSYDCQESSGDRHGTFCYRGRTYTK